LLQRALELAPTEGDLYFSLGLALVRMGRLEEGIDIFEQGTVYAPFNPALYTNLGAAYASQGAYEAARTVLERSLELATFPLPRLHLTHTNLALIHLAQRRPDEAVKALQNALFIYLSRIPLCPRPVGPAYSRQ
jgi:tetratricopeptide (TPR) repeat protein